MSTYDSYCNLKRLSSCNNQPQIGENIEEYETKKYKHNYCGIERTYRNVLFFACVGELRGVEFIIAREIFSKIELDELKKYCPCINCYKKEINTPNLFKIYFNSGKYCLKNDIKIDPLIQEARKLKIQELTSHNKTLLENDSNNIN